VALLVLLALIIVLLLSRHERAADVGALLRELIRSWTMLWLNRAVQSNWSASALLLMAVGIPAALVSVFVLLFKGFALGLISLLISVLVLSIILLERPSFKALRDQKRLWLLADEEHKSVLAITPSDQLIAAAMPEYERVRQEYIQDDFGRFFSPLFYFLLFGAPAAVIYYLINLLSDDKTDDDFVLISRIKWWLDWPVARVVALTLALAGDFVKTWQYCRTDLLNRHVSGLDYLQAAVGQAQESHLQIAEHNPGHVMAKEMDAVVALMDRALVTWVVFFSLHTLWP
jgi:AmpE protein